AYACFASLPRLLLGSAEELTLAARAMSRHLTFLCRTFSRFIRFIPCAQFFRSSSRDTDFTQRHISPFGQRWRSHHTGWIPAVCMQFLETVAARTRCTFTVELGVNMPRSF